MLDYVKIAELLVALAVALGLGSCVVGCAPSATELAQTQIALAEQLKSTAMPSDLSTGIKEMFAMIKDQGIMDRFLTRASANGQNPGLALTRRTTESLIIHLDGLDVQVTGEAEGGGTMLPTGTRELLLKVLADIGTSTNPELVQLREWILKVVFGKGAFPTQPAGAGNIPPQALEN